MSNLPKRIVVDQNGNYWRDFGDSYSMCPVSDDNEPVEIAAVYEPALSQKDVGLAGEPCGAKTEETRQIKPDMEQSVPGGLAVTNEKDFAMVELWDDRCVCVEINTGKVLGRNER